jgi:hypothetical protein
MIAVLVSLALQLIDYLATLLVKRKNAPLLCFGRASSWGILF